MYEHITGKLWESTPATAVIHCYGVGYLMHISLYTFTALGEKDKNKDVTLYTHLIVREDAHMLFGFASKKERELFRLLIGVNGVGANTARMILSSLSPEEVTEAILGGQVETLKSVKGIGAKSAQRIILDLKDRLKKGAEQGDILPSTHNTTRAEALSALTMLGFPESTADRALTKVLRSLPADASVENIIKEALKAL